MEQLATVSRDGRAGLGRREADARDRAHATLLQGVVAVLVIAAVSGLVTWVRAEEFSPAVLLASGATAVATAVLTYLQRAYLDPYREIRRLLSSPPPGRNGHADQARTVEGPLLRAQSSSPVPTEHTPISTEDGRRLARR